MQGQPTNPIDHNGGQTFVAKVGTAQYMVQEFDQARTLVSHLPAAAAEVMLRRREYILKISVSRRCDSGNICVDVFRTWGSNVPPFPEQQWTIDASTGLPVTVRFVLPRVGNDLRSQWEDVRFLRYAAERELVIPVATEFTKPSGTKEAWTFVSLKENCGFDPASFDQEVAR